MNATQELNVMVENQFWNNCVKLELGKIKGFSNFEKDLGFNSRQGEYFKNNILPRLISDKLIIVREPKGVYRKGRVAVCDVLVSYLFTDEGDSRIQKEWAKITTISQNDNPNKQNTNEKIDINIVNNNISSEHSNININPQNSTILNYKA
ncbi:MAG: hypothetical protein K2P99_01080 [Burkholderiales bacterium]|nr:hypothetical protein [Burkholderiales bacterium]